MKSQTIVGRGFSFKIPADGSASMEAHEGSRQRGIGFRLVHDDSERVIRDGSWRNKGAYIREGHYGMVDPHYCSSTLGFRLAREGA